MAKSWGKYSQSNCQIYPGGPSSVIPPLTLSLNKENNDEPTRVLEWRLFEFFFKNLKSYNDGVAETDEFVREIPKDSIFKSEADALVFFNSSGANLTTRSVVRIKQIKSIIEGHNDSTQRVSLDLVRLVATQELQKILSQIPIKILTPSCSSADLTSRSSTSECSRRSLTSDSKSALTPRQLRHKRGHTRDKVLNRMLTRAYSTVNESLGSSKSDANDSYPMKRRNSAGDLSTGVTAVAGMDFYQRVSVEQFLTSRGC